MENNPVMFETTNQLSMMIIHYCSVSSILIHDITDDFPINLPIFCGRAEPWTPGLFLVMEAQGLGGHLHRPWRNQRI
jgi:hypothetical protein